jgi:putative hydrolase of the HAD superfamily
VANSEDIRWVLFDLGGVFVAASAGDVARRVAQELGVPRRRLLDAAGSYLPAVTRGEITLRQAYSGLVDDLGTAVSPDQVLDVHLAEFRRQCSEHDPQAVDLARRLRQEFRVACLTNTEPEVAEICRRSGLFDYFERAFTSVDLGLAKPDPEIYRVVAEDLGCPTGCIFFTDDRPENIEGARCAGMRAVQWRGVEDFEARLRSAASEA